MIFPRAALAALMAAMMAGAHAGAQDAPRLQPEARLDGFMGDSWAMHAGLGATAPLGTYVRFGIVGGLGTGAGGVSGRADLIARFTLDPFRERRWAPYGVGGVSSRFGGGSRNALVLLAGLEGPPRRGVATALELGFGGGFRAGVILRRAFPRRR
ncbi:MAG: hypothetical protein WDZ58_07060 [Gemmatimonadaceae bacterium]